MHVEQYFASILQGNNTCNTCVTDGKRRHYERRGPQKESKGEDTYNRHKKHKESISKIFTNLYVLF
jgi:hypothetical protein